MVDTSIGEAEEITVAHELTARQSGEENVMDARMGVEAITSRIGAIALPLGIILLVVATAFHPSREAAMDNPAVFMEYAQSDIWVTVHLIQWVAFLLVFSGMGALYCSITTKSDLHAAVARFGLAAVVLTAATHTMLQAVDGVALKWAVDVWASAPADQEGAAFAAAEALRYTEYAIQSLFTILLGLTLILYGLPIALGTVYPRWLGWVAMGSGVAWIAHGLRVPYIGLFDSIPGVVGSVLLYLWAFIMAFLMWRNSSLGRIARLESTSTGSAKLPASPR